MNYETVIGLEVHAELSTKSKIYCSCTTEFGGEVNTHCCPICTGMPGVLPVLNKSVVEYAVKAGLATGCTIAEYSKQDRKNYFYPDLPKAYQISQFDLPLCSNGYIDIEVDGITKRIGIVRIHIEEDAGKLLHDEWDMGSLIDYNRCGVPLIEIVGSPDLRSAAEAKAYVEKLKLILEYIGVSDCKMQEGSLRADVNISVRKKGQKEFGTRTEMKNLNSFRSIMRAIESESKRQISELESGRAVIQETRRWDDDKGISYSMRSKEEAHDYRYFPEPDLVPVVVGEKWIDEIRASLPELPDARKKRLIKEYGISKSAASFIVINKDLAINSEKALIVSLNCNVTANLIVGPKQSIMSDRKIDYKNDPIPPKYIAELSDLIATGAVNSTMGNKVLGKMYDSGKASGIIVEEEGLEVVSDESALAAVVEKIIEANPQSVADYKGGKDKAFAFLVGQTMRETKGKANPQLINRLLKEELNKLDKA